MATKVLVADNHGLVREAICSLLRNEFDMDIVGQAEDGRIAVQLARELRPDIVVIETSMPNLNGIEATRQIVHELPQVKVLALSASSDRRSVCEMLRAGASGYLPKRCAFQELVSAIQNVVSNRTYLSSHISGLVIDEYLHGAAEQRDQRITKVNDAMLEQYGSSREQFLGMTPGDFYSYDIAYGRDIWKRCFDAGRLHVETQERKLDGAPIWIEGDYICLYDSEGRITGHFSIQRDVTDRKRAEAALRKSEERYRMLAETMNDGLGQIDKNGTCIYANKRYGEILGYSADEIIGKHFAEVFDREAQEALAAQLAKRRKGVAKPYEIATTRKDGRKISLQISPRCLLDTDGIFMGSIAIMADITDRKKISDQLHNDREKLKAMASKLLLTQERERRLLAVELHDNICQGLVLIKLALESSLHLISDTNVLGSVKIACGAIGETIEEAESLTFALSNPVLNQFGFVAALDKYLVEEIQKKYGIKCELDSSGRLGKLHDETKTCLFRVTRELLTNVVKHAHASKIMARVHNSGEKIRVTVQDDGVGFKDNQAGPGASETTRFGLFSMREQLDYLGGSIRIKSKPGRGTTAMIVVRLKEEAIV